MNEFGNPIIVHTNSNSPNSTKKRTTPKKPLYSWERSAEKQPVRERKGFQLSDGSEFIPSVTNGFYEKRGAVHSTPTFIDFQVVLTAENYEELLKRRRRKNAESLHINRFGSGQKKESGDFLASSSPYMDPKRIEDSLYRVKGEKRLVF